MLDNEDTVVDPHGPVDIDEDEDDPQSEKHDISSVESQEQPLKKKLREAADDTSSEIAIDYIARIYWFQDRNMVDPSAAAVWYSLRKHVLKGGPRTH